MTVNLGPAGLAQLNGKSSNASWEFDYNPRCLKRSLTDDSNRRFANETSVLTLLTEPQDIYTFEYTMQGYPGTDQLGVHGAYFSIPFPKHGITMLTFPLFRRRPFFPRSVAIRASQSARNDKN